KLFDALGRTELGLARIARFEISITGFQVSITSFEVFITGFKIIKVELDRLRRCRRRVIRFSLSLKTCLHRFDLGSVQLPGKRCPTVYTRRPFGLIQSAVWTNHD